MSAVQHAAWILFSPPRPKKIQKLLILRLLQ